MGGPEQKASLKIINSWIYHFSWNAVSYNLTINSISCLLFKIVFHVLATIGIVLTSKGVTLMSGKSMLLFLLFSNQLIFSSFFRKTGTLRSAHIFEIQIGGRRRGVMVQMTTTCRMALCKSSSSSELNTSITSVGWLFLQLPSASLLTDLWEPPVGQPVIWGFPAPSSCNFSEFRASAWQTTPLSGSLSELSEGNSFSPSESDDMTIYELLMSTLGGRKKTWYFTGQQQLQFSRKQAVMECPWLPTLELVKNKTEWICLPFGEPFQKTTTTNKQKIETRIMGLLVFDAKRKLRIGLFVCLFSVLAVCLSSDADGRPGRFDSAASAHRFLESSKCVLCGRCSCDFVPLLLLSFNGPQSTCRLFCRL